MRFARLDGFMPTAGSREGYDHYRGLETPFEVTNDARAWLARVDVNLPRGNRLNVRYNGSTNRALNSDGVGGVITPTTPRSLETTGTEEDSTQTAVGQFMSAPSSNLLFELRGQYSREDRPRSANALKPLVDLSLGEFGTRSFRPTIQFDWRAQAGGNVTWLTGDARREGGLRLQPRLHRPDVRLLPERRLSRLRVGRRDDAGHHRRRRRHSEPVRHAVTNLPAADRQSEDIVRDRRVRTVHAGRVARGADLDGQLRWDGQFNPAPEADNPILLGQLRGVIFPIGRTVDPTTIPSSGLQFGPRAGIAWDPTGGVKTVVRGFAGIYYARTPLLLLAGPVNNFRVPPGDVTVALPFRVTPENPNDTLYEQMKLIGIDLNERTLDTLPTLTPDQMTAIATALGIDNNPFAGARVTLIREDFRNPMARQVGAGVQHEISPGRSLGADVLVVDTIRLERNRDLNVPLPTVRSDDPAQPPFFGLRSGTARPVPGLDSVTVRESTASALYRALTVRSEIRRPWGQFNAYYVLSKNESNDDNERSAGGVSYENAYDLASEYGPGTLDRRHQFHVTGVVMLPPAPSTSRPGCTSSRAPRSMRAWAPIRTRIGAAPTVPTAHPACRSPETRSATSRLPISTCGCKSGSRSAGPGRRSYRWSSSASSTATTSRSTRVSPPSPTTAPVRAIWPVAWADGRRTPTSPRPAAETATI